MIKILRIINRFNLGGPTYNAAYLSRYLPENFETKLIGGANQASENSSLFILEKIGVKGEVIEEMRRSINPFNDLKAYLKIRKILKQYKPDIVHTHASKAGTLGRLAAIRLKVPVIVHTYHGHIFHSYFSSFKTFIFKTIERFLARRSDAIVVISELQRNELCNIFKIVPSKKAHVIPLGFDLSRFFNINSDDRTRFRKLYNIQNEEILSVIVGRMAPVKNHGMVVHIVKTLRDKYQNDKIKIMIVGDGETRTEIEQMFINEYFTISTPEKPDNNAQIIFTSWIFEIEKVYTGADISFLTSLNEGTPVSLIESLASGVPIVSTNVGGIADFVSDGEHGFLVESNDHELFAERLNRLSIDHELRKNMSEKGRKQVEEKFSYTRLVDDVAKLYLGLMDLKKN